MRTALVVAHPGHELRLPAWIGRVRPTLHIIARGSRSGRSGVRVEASRGVAETLGAGIGSPFGARCDVDLYAAILASDATPFLALTDALVDGFRAAGTRRVVADAWQNYNPVHDLTHLMARVAAAETGATFADFPVVLGGLAHAPAGPVVETIEPTADERRLAFDLIARYPEIAGDVAGLVAAAGDAVFGPETLHAPLPPGDLLPSGPPWYEAWGEGRVAAGVYDHCLRWSHMEPVVRALTARLEAAP